MFKKITTPIALVIIMLLLGVDTVSAGSLTPPGAPANTMYTLTDIYSLSAGTTATLGSGTIPTTPSSIVASFKTLTEIYDAIIAQIVTLSNAKIAKNVSAFGFTGTLFGDTDAAKVLSTATYPGTMPTNTLSVANDTVSAGYYAATTLSAVDTDLAEGNIKSGVNIFGKIGTVAPGAQLIKTNQIICYGEDGSVVACGSTGQDGQYLKGVARQYTDPVNGTITDNTTGLMWKKCSEGRSGASCGTGTATTFTWVNALAQCENSTDNGYDDWRLPNVYELYSLVDFGVASAPFINGTYFPATQSSYYWSSTTYPAKDANAMYVSFGSGLAYGSNKTGSNYVRCVRG